MHFTLNQYAWDSLNEYTKNEFEKADAKDIFINCEYPIHDWKSPDDDNNRAKDTKKFGGGHSNINACIEAANHYINSSQVHFIKGGDLNMKWAAYYLSYALHFVADTSCPVHRMTTSPKEFTSSYRTHKRYENVNIPNNRASKDKIVEQVVNGKRKTVIKSFGKPLTYNADEMKFTNENVKGGSEYESIVNLIPDVPDIKGEGYKVMNETENGTFIETEYGTWANIVVKPHTKDQEKALIKNHVAYAMKYLLKFCEGSQINNLYYADNPLLPPRPVPSNTDPSEEIILPTYIPIEKDVPPLETDPSMSWGTNVLVLNENNEVIRWLSNRKVEIDENNVINGFKTCSLFTGMIDGNIYGNEDDIIFKHGNKLFINGDSDNERCLYRFNTKITKDYLYRTIDAEADEVFSDLANVPPFYIHDPAVNKYVSGNRILISKEFLAQLLKGYYIIDDGTTIQLDHIEPAKKMIPVNGTISILDLLRKIENHTGLYFKRHYTGMLNQGKYIIEQKIELLRPAIELPSFIDEYKEYESRNKFPELGIINAYYYARDTDKIYQWIRSAQGNYNYFIVAGYGRIHSAPKEAIRLGVNTNKLTFGINEEHNAVGIAPIFDNDNTSDQSLTNEVLKHWMKIEANSDKVAEVDTEYSSETIRISEPDTGISSPTPANQVKEEDLYHASASLPYVATKIGDNNLLEFTESIIGSKSIIRLKKYMSESDVILKVRKNSRTLTPNGKVSITVRSVGLKDNDVEQQRSIIFKGNKVRECSPQQLLAGICTEYSEDVNITPGSGQNKWGVDDNSLITIDTGKREITFTKQWYDPNASTKTLKKEELLVTKMKREGVLPPLKKAVKCTCGESETGKKFKEVFQNTCPYCKETHTTGGGGKSVFEWVKAKTKKKVKVKKKIESGKETVEVIKTTNKYSYQLQCKKCGAKFCGADGNNVNRKENKKLSSIGSLSSEEAKFKSKTEQRTKVERIIEQPVGGYVKNQITVFENKEDGKLSENQALFTDIFTGEFPRFYGDVEIELQGCSLDSVEAKGVIFYDFAEFPHIKKEGESYIVAEDWDELEFDFKQIVNKPKLINLPVSATNVEDLIIELWKHLEGADGNNKPLEIIEDVDLDIVDKTNTIYNVGDVVFLKLPNGLTFKSMVTETSKNRAKRGESSIKVGQIINTPLQILGR